MPLKSLKTAIALSALLLPGICRAYDFMDKGFAFNVISESEKLCALVSAEDEPQYIEDYISPYTGDIIIPEYASFNGTDYRVYQIEEYAFFNCRNLTSLVFPATLKAIKNNAFVGCRTEEYINEEGYRDYLPLSKIVIQDSPDPITIGYYNWSSTSSHCLFFGLSATELYLGRNVSFYSSYDKGYYGPFCIGLEKVYIGDYVTEITDGLKIGGFYGISELRLSPNLTKIGRHAFNRSLNLRSIIIPEGVKTIGSNAFYGNRSLYDVALPSSLTLIETYGFAQCNNIAVVLCNATTPPANGGGESSWVSNARLRVPAESVDLYKSATFWKTFGEILPIEGDSNPYPTSYKVNIHFPEGGAVRHYVKGGQSLCFSLHPTEGWNLYLVTSNGNDITDKADSDGLFTLGPIHQDTDVNIVFSKGGETGVSTVSTDSPYRVTALGKRINISGQYNNASLFNINGQCELLYCPNEFQIETPGLYILNVDGTSFKFLIAE